MDSILYENYLNILKQELVPALDVQNRLQLPIQRQKHVRFLENFQIL